MTEVICRASSHGHGARTVAVLAIGGAAAVEAEWARTGGEVSGHTDEPNHVRYLLELPLDPTNIPKKGKAGDSATFTCAFGTMFRTPAISCNDHIVLDLDVYKL